MDEDVGVAHLVEGRLEGVDEMGGKLAYEAYGIGQEEGEVVDDYLADGSVECGEKLVSAKTSLLARRFISVDLPTLV